LSIVQRRVFGVKRLGLLVNQGDGGLIEPMCRPVDLGILLAPEVDEVERTLDACPSSQHAGR
jgi:hypothetical protein